MALRKPLNFATKTVEQKMAEINHTANESKVISSPISTDNTDIEIIKSDVDKSPLALEQAMRKYNLVKRKKGLRVDLDEDLHTDFRIAAIKLGKTHEEIVEDLIISFLRKENKKIEK